MLGQLFIVLNHSEQIHQVAVIVVEDFFLRLWLTEEHLRTAHTGFNVDIVLWHHGQDSVNDATFVSCVGQWAGGCRQFL